MTHDYSGYFSCMFIRFSGDNPAPEHGQANPRPKLEFAYFGMCKEYFYLKEMLAWGYRVAKMFFMPGGKCSVRRP